MKHHIPRYSCSRAWMDNGGPHCIAFGGLRVDDAIEEALLGVVGPGRYRRCNRCRQGSRGTAGSGCAMLSVVTLEAARYGRRPGLPGNTMAADPTNWLVGERA